MRGRISERERKPVGVYCTKYRRYPNTIGWLGRYLGSYVPGDRQLKPHERLNWTVFRSGCWFGSSVTKSEFWCSIGFFLRTHPEIHDERARVF